MNESTGKNRRLLLIPLALALSIPPIAILAAGARSRASEPEPSPSPLPPPPRLSCGVTPGTYPTDGKAVVDRRARDVLLESLEHPDPAVRARTAEGLSWLGDATWRAPLEERFAAEPDGAVQSSLALALARLGAFDSRVEFRKKFDESAGAVAVQYAHALWLAGERDVLDWLKRQTDEGDDVEVAMQAALVLAEISPTGDSENAERLQRVAEAWKQAAPDGEHRLVTDVKVLVLLGRLGHGGVREHMERNLEGSDDRVRLVAAEVLSALGVHRGREVALELLQAFEPDIRLQAALFLAASDGTSGVDQVVDCACDETAERRTRCLEVIGDMGDCRYLPHLQYCSRSRNGLARSEAAISVLRILGLDPRLLVRETRAFIDAALGERRHVPVPGLADLIVRLPVDDSNRYVLAVLSEPEGPGRPELVAKVPWRERPELASVLGLSWQLERQRLAKNKDARPDATLERSLLIAMGESRDPTYIDLLRPLLDERDAFGVVAQGSLLALLRAPENTDEFDAGVNRLTGWYKSRAEHRLDIVDAAMRARDPRLIPLLEVALQAREPAVRLAAAVGLAGYDRGEAPVLETLNTAVAGTDPLAAARALTALARLGIEPSGQFSVEAFLLHPDPRVRLAMVPAIALLPWERALPALLSSLQDSDAAVRRRTINALLEFHPEYETHVISMLRFATHDLDIVTRLQAKVTLASLLPMEPWLEWERSLAAGGGAGHGSAGEDRPVSEQLDELRMQLRDATIALQSKRQAIAEMSATIGRQTSLRARNQDEVRRVKDLAEELVPLQDQLLADYVKVGQLFFQARSLVVRGEQQIDEEFHQAWTVASETVSVSGVQIISAVEQANAYAYDRCESSAALSLEAASDAIQLGEFRKARGALRCARRLEPKNPVTQRIWGEYYQALAEQKTGPKKIAALVEARKRYVRFLARNGDSSPIRKRIRRIDDQLVALGAAPGDGGGAP